MHRNIWPLAALLLGLGGAAVADEGARPLAFADFFVQPIGPRGLQPTPRLLAAVGQPVQLTGFIVKREQPLPGHFLLTPRPVSMAEHADGEADDLPAQTVTVLLPASQRDRIVAAEPGPVTLSGRLAWGPAEDETGRVSWLRLQLDEGALAVAPGTPAAPANRHSH